VARAGAVGDATVERHADETDVDLIQPHGVGEAEEGRDSAVARLHLRRLLRARFKRPGNSHAAETADDPESAASPSPVARGERVQRTHDIPQAQQHIAKRQADEEGEQ
jgi:hypothetical protein